MRTQHNAWIHAAINVAVFAVALWLGLPATHWAILVLAAALVWTAELFNTALEAAVDMSVSEVHPLAKIAKDVAAGAVLSAACAAVVVGLLIVGPPLFSRLD